MERLAYTVAEAAEVCGISERQMRRLIASGEIHAARMGDLRIGREELTRFLLGLPRPTIATDCSQTVAIPQSGIAFSRPSTPVCREKKSPMQRGVK